MIVNIKCDLHKWIVKCINKVKLLLGLMSVLQIGNNTLQN